MRRNLSQYAVLGLLAGGPRTGYEVAKEISTVLSHFWHESDGQIYPVLNQLSEAGLAEREEEPNVPGRRRVTYHITADGRESLADWLALPAQPLPPRHEVLLKLFFGRHARAGDLRKVLSAYRDTARAALTRLEEQSSLVRAEHGAHPDALYWLLSMDFGLGTLRAITAWCDTALATLDGKENPHQ